MFFCSLLRWPFNVNYYFGRFLIMSSSGSLVYEWKCSQLIALINVDMMGQKEDA